MKYFIPLMFGLLSLSSVASASPDANMRGLCGDRTKIVTTLEKRYAEEPVSMGLAGSGGLLEVFLSDKGSWTIIMTRPTGQSCILSAGDDWENLASPQKDSKI